MGNRVRTRPATCLPRLEGFGIDRCQGCGDSWNRRRGWAQSKPNQCTTSVAILAQAISCSNVRGVFPVHERFCFCLVQLSTTQFCSFPSFPMARVSDGTNVPISPSSNMGSVNGSLPDLEGVGGHLQVQWRKNSKPCLPKDLPSSRSTSQRWPQFLCLYRDSAGFKTVYCLLHNQGHLSQTKFRTLNSLLTVSQLVSQLWRLVRPLFQAALTREDLGTYLDTVMMMP